MNKKLPSCIFNIVKIFYSQQIERRINFNEQEVASIWSMLVQSSISKNNSRLKETVEHNFCRIITVFVFHLCVILYPHNRVVPSVKIEWEKSQIVWWFLVVHPEIWLLNINILWKDLICHNVLFDLPVFDFMILIQWRHAKTMLFVSFIIIHTC